MNIARIVKLYERLLTAGIWSNILVNYDDSFATATRPFPS